MAEPALPNGISRRAITSRIVSRALGARQKLGSSVARVQYTMSVEQVSSEDRACRRRRGRPNSFDRGIALETAMRVFWTHGYDGASIALIVEAMKSTPSTLYYSFRSKDGLFLHAVELYCSQHFWPTMSASGGADVHRQIESWLEASAKRFVSPDIPPGCLLVVAASSSATAGESVRQAVRELRQRAVLVVERLIRDAALRGELTNDADAGRLASFFFAVYEGMSVQAVDGATEEQLMASVRLAMSAWAASGFAAAS